MGEKLDGGDDLPLDGEPFWLASIILEKHNHAAIHLAVPKRLLHFYGHASLTARLNAVCHLGDNQRGCQLNLPDFQESLAIVPKCEGMADFCIQSEFGEAVHRRFADLGT